MYRPRKVNPIIKLVENCNYNCAFCRYANHPPTAASVMDYELCEKIIREAALYNLEQGKNGLSFILHGGEPLLWGKENFRKLQAFEQAFMQEHKGFIFENCMQSNGNLIDEEWLSIIKDLDIHVGLSVDGPVELNFHYGAQGREASLNKVLDNAKKMQELNVQLGFLSVITEDHVGHAKEFMDFLAENNIYNPGFCYCYNETDNCSIDPLRLADFLCDVFDIYYHSSKQFRIREFDALLSKIYGLKRGACNAKCREDCGIFITFTPDGNISFCDSYEAGTLIIGNINTDTLDSIISSDKYQKAKESYLYARMHACSDCDFLQVCGCGCGRNDQGEGSARKSYFCETYKVLIKHALNVAANDPNLVKENEMIIPELRKYIESGSKTT